METAILKCTNVHIIHIYQPPHKIYELQGGGVGVTLHKIFVHVHQYDSMKAKQTLGYKIKGRRVDGEGCFGRMVSPMCTIQYSG